MSKLPYTALKLGVFATVCALCTALVVNTLNQPFGRAVTYHAVFTDALGVKPGSDVRIAGVRVGKVARMALDGRTALVTFEVADDQEIPADAKATVRYADLLGARYVSLAPGGDASKRLPENGTIPVAHTAPALDLTALFNGFKPIFDLLRPSEVNQLTKEIVAVFQGEGPTIDALLSKVVTLTQTFAGQDKVIGEVLANLQPVLDTTIGHAQDFRKLVSGLGDLVGGLAANRDTITSALDSGAKLAGTLADVTTRLTPSITKDLASLNRLSASLLANREPIVGALRDMPGLLGRVTGTMDYGGWMNVYLCDLGINVGGLGVSSAIGPHSAVCR
ncbi:MCE family protein [Amycolatopsis sp. CA-230715]|uniref:MCE family protein n=1 Tax=Amycolatopsis sp. CA-230715 TaxID=2745196 RepID=UPI001C02C9E5|nr:MCE family protein [Amycolatopsis sp. CA-230715]QWF83867.1 hypothetical protein HUW46_07310 [Amycolatopsis sp. CA-230715]